MVNTTLRVLDISDNCLSNIYNLSRALSCNRGLETVDLSENAFGPYSLWGVVEALGPSSTLRRLRLKGNKHRLEMVGLGQLSSMPDLCLEIDDCVAERI